MKQIWQKHAGALALTFALLAGLLPAASAKAVEPSALSPQQAGAYAKVLEKVQFYRDETSTQRHQLAYAELMDFNGDGIQELYFIYGILNDDRSYTEVGQEVWTWEKGQAILALSLKDAVGGGESTPGHYTLAQKNGLHLERSCGSMRMGFSNFVGTAYYYRGGTNCDIYEYSSSTPPDLDNAVKLSKRP